jgi:hypothetical protein
MRKLGEQWVEEIDGKPHMVKAVKQTNKCSGCVFCTSIWCADHNQSERDFDCMTMIIKDLGVLNEDGCLPAPWNKELYPDFYNASKTLWCIHAESDDNDLEMKAAGNSKQEAIDAWNRRT